MKPIYIEPFLSPHQLDEIEKELLSLEWETKRTAREEYFMADETTDYSYGRQDDGITYTSKPWSPEVFALKTTIQYAPQFEGMGCVFNGCFLNRYVDQHNHLGWHADDFVGMDPAAPIAVMSFGAEREIWVKDKRGFPCATCEGSGYLRDGAFCPACGVPALIGEGQVGTGFTKTCSRGPVPPEDRYLLQRGSLFIMPPGFQDVMLHRIPKHPQPCGWRISLTFRKFL